MSVYRWTQYQTDHPSSASQIKPKARILMEALDEKINAFLEGKKHREQEIFKRHPFHTAAALQGFSSTLPIPPALLLYTPQETLHLLKALSSLQEESLRLKNITDKNSRHYLSLMQEGVRLQQRQLIELILQQLEACYESGQLVALPLLRHYAKEDVPPFALRSPFKEHLMSSEESFPFSRTSLQDYLQVLNSSIGDTHRKPLYEWFRKSLKGQSNHAVEPPELSSLFNKLRSWTQQFLEQLYLRLLLWSCQSTQLYDRLYQHLRVNALLLSLKKEPFRQSHHTEWLLASINAYQSPSDIKGWGHWLFQQLTKKRKEEQKILLIQYCILWILERYTVSLLADEPYEQVHQFLTQHHPESAIRLQTIQKYLKEKRYASLMKNIPWITEQFQNPDATSLWLSHIILQYFKNHASAKAEYTHYLNSNPYGLYVRHWNTLLKNTFDELAHNASEPNIPQKRLFPFKFIGLHRTEEQQALLEHSLLKISALSLEKNTLPQQQPILRCALQGLPVSQYKKLIHALPVWHESLQSFLNTQHLMASRLYYWRALKQSHEEADTGLIAYSRSLTPQGLIHQMGPASTLEMNTWLQTLLKAFQSNVYSPALQEWSQQWSSIFSLRWFKTYTQYHPQSTALISHLKNCLSPYRLLNTELAHQPSVSLEDRFSETVSRYCHPHTHLSFKKMLHRALRARFIWLMQQRWHWQRVLTHASHTALRRFMDELIFKMPSFPRKKLICTLYEQKEHWTAWIHAFHQHLIVRIHDPFQAWFPRSLPEFKLMLEAIAMGLIPMNYRHRLLESLHTHASVCPDTELKVFIKTLTTVVQAGEIPRRASWSDILEQHQHWLSREINYSLTPSQQLEWTVLEQWLVSNTPLPPLQAQECVDAWWIQSLSSNNPSIYWQWVNQKINRYLSELDNPSTLSKVSRKNHLSLFQAIHSLPTLTPSLQQRLQSHLSTPHIYPRSTGHDSSF